MKNISIEALQKKAKQFVQVRDWEQYQNPKDVCIALAKEAAELMEIFLWMNSEEVSKITSDQKKISDIWDELADVFYWVIRLADILNIDLEEAFHKKLEKNKLKYPVVLCKGKSMKYTKLQEKSRTNSTDIDL